MQKDCHIEINIAEQRLRLFNGNDLAKEYSISTAKNGPGEQLDSECTPRGEHIITEKIGDGCKPNTVFVSRESTGELYHPKLREQFPDRDWILTRILWLTGTESGRNQGGDVDSHDRYIYIHGIVMPGAGVSSGSVASGSRPSAELAGMCTRANPKSKSLTAPAVVRKIFPGLMSR